LIKNSMESKLRVPIAVQARARAPTRTGATIHRRASLFAIPPSKTNLCLGPVACSGSLGSVGARGIEVMSQRVKLRRESCRRLAHLSFGAC